MGLGERIDAWRDRRLGKVQRDSLPLSVQDWVDLFSYNGTTYPLIHQTLVQGPTEAIGPGFSAYARTGYAANSVIFACMAVRLLLFSEARFLYQQMIDGRPGQFYSRPTLDIVENPWPNGVTADLLTRAIVDVDLAGNFFTVRRGDRLRRLRPDWVKIILGSDSDPTAEAGDVDAEVLGYLYQPGGPGSGRDPVAFSREEVGHFAPYPDPTAWFRGMSWITPVVREVMADSAATTHKLKFFENGATPNMVVKFDPSVTKDLYDAYVKSIEEKNAGAANAYKTLYLGGGADATVVGANFQQLDFKVTQGAGETRIAAAAGVPPMIVGLSEGLQASTYTNYTQARRRLADGTMRPLWRSMAGALASVIAVPPGSRLWYDDRDIPWVQEDRKDAAEVQQVQAAAMNSLIAAGFMPDAVVEAITSGDLTRLTHSGLFSVQLQPAGSEPQVPAEAGRALAKLIRPHLDAGD